MKRSLLLALAVLLPAPAAAQVEAALDIGIAHDHVWRGLRRVGRPVVTPAAALAWKTPRLMVSAGGWALLEPWSPREQDFTIAGRDATLGQLDAWAQADYRLRFFSATIDATAGWIGYTYHGDDGGGGFTDDSNTSELYLGLRLMGLRELYAVIGLPPDLPIGLETTVAFDLGPIGGTHLTAGLLAELPVFFVGEPLGAATLRLTSGWSWNQELRLDEPGYFQGEGLTHVALAAGMTPFFRLGALPATLHLEGAVQLGIDEATRRRRLPASSSRVSGHVAATFSLLYPLRSVQ